MEQKTRAPLLLLLLSVLSLMVASCDGYRILGVFPLHARSHWAMFEGLMKGLARKGHQVDVVSLFPLKERYPNYTDIVTLSLPPDLPPLVNNLPYEMVTTSMRNNPVYTVATLGGNQVCEGHLSNPQVQQLIHNPPKDPPYDVFVTEIFGANCFVAIGHHLKVPVVGVSTAALYPWINRVIANPENLAIVPNNLYDFVGKMSFWDRVGNVLTSLYFTWYYDHLTQEQDEIMRKYISRDLPSVREVERNLAMILVNTHYSLNGAKPMTPALIEVGGLHVQDDGPEPSPELKKWMDKSTEGFVYFSFGSMVKIESFPPRILNIFYESLRKLAPRRVLMKIPHPEELPPGLPSNVRTEKWIPQLKVLKHRNIKAFVTHGGLMGTQEAMHCGVPLVGIPLFADQFVNIDLMVNKNIAVKVDLETITQEVMDEALNTVLTNRTYAESARKFSAKFLDRPMTAIDTATYWVEHAVRHGSRDLRSPALDLHWWEIALIDVWAVIILSASIALYLIFLIVRVLASVVSRYFQQSHRKLD